ncbi:hypothetical protein DRQ29_04800, partial [bacterium]
TGVNLPTDTSSVFLNIELVRADTIYFSDFETDSGGLTVRNFVYYQDWQWGEPTTGDSFPEYIPSGNKLWGTELTANYSDSSQSRLILDVDLSTYEKASLVYDEWYRFQPVNWSSSDTVAHDGGQIKIATTTDTSVISPYWGYRFVSSEYNWLMNEGDSIFADDEPGTPWHKVVVPLDYYCGQTISIFWDFGSSNRNTGVGWFIDDIAVVAPGSSVGIAETELPYRLNISAYPNPFNSSVAITISGIAGNSGGQCDEMTLKVYDLRGNLIATLCSADKSASLVPLDKGDRNRASAKVSGGSWTSERSVSEASKGFIWTPDETIPSGIYLVKINCGNSIISSKKLILIR